MLKKIILPAALAAFLLTAGCALKAEKVYPFPFETAKIELTLTGSVEGKQTVYIKGDKIVNETHAVKKADGKEEKIDSLYLNLGEFVYQINLNGKTGVRTSNPVYEELIKLPADQRMTYLVKASIGLSSPGAEAPQSTGSKEIAGQKCDVYSIGTVGETCLWNGMPLYISVKIPDAGVDNTGTATSVEVGLAIPDKIFEIPADVKVQ